MTSTERDAEKVGAGMCAAESQTPLPPGFARAAKLVVKLVGEFGKDVQFKGKDLGISIFYEAYLSPYLIGRVNKQLSEIRTISQITNKFGTVISCYSLRILAASRPNEVSLRTKNKLRWPQEGTWARIRNFKNQNYYANSGASK